MHKTILFLRILITKNNKNFIFYKMAGAPGFEPGMPIPKTGALPLGYAPMFFSYRKDI